ncbi:MAG: hypothetical protein FVQ79_03435 [Planctomycetes bacterium]|nr:hypothetical protein [Planctomycetota bacterium]
MARHFLAGLVLTALFAQSVQADQFLHRKTGESFYGYPTNRTRKNTTQVFELQGDTFKRKSIDLAEYQVTYKAKGRKNNVVILPIQNPNVLMSKAVSKILSETIIQTANKGPRYILLEIDCPGGRGEYMKEIVAAVSKTDNCPVIAFISGGTTGGAFSAAAAVALSCDAVFIAPDATMGTFAPVKNITAAGDDPKDTYSHASLASYGTYIAALAEKAGRNGALAAAMIDTGIEIIEVSVANAGTRKFIDKAEKQGSDAIIRTWSKKIKKTASSPVYTQNGIVTVNPLEYQLTITAQEAVHAHMADKILNSREEVLAFLGVSDAKKQLTSRIDRGIRTFAKNKRVMEQLFFNIGELEIRENELETLLKELAEEARYSAASDLEQRRLRKLKYNDYQQRMREKDKHKITRPSSRTPLRPRRNNVKSSPNRQRANRGAVNNIDPYLIRENMIRNELWQVLNDLSVNYSRVIGLGRKYPGTLPAGKNFKTAENRYNKVLAKLNSGYFSR